MSIEKQAAQQESGQVFPLVQILAHGPPDSSLCAAWAVSVKVLMLTSSHWQQTYHGQCFMVLTLLHLHLVTKLRQPYATAS